MAVVDINLVRSLIVQQLALSTTYTSSPAANTRLFGNGLRDMILAFDGQVVRSILNDPNNGRRKDFVLSATLTNGAAIPTHIGPIDGVKINGIPASIASLDLIRRLRTNALALPCDPYYTIEGQRIFHNATVANFGVTTADIDYYDYVQDVTTFLCKAPSDYTVLEVAGCLAMLASVDGDDTPLASLYLGAAVAFQRMTGQSVPALGELGQIAQ